MQVHGREVLGAQAMAGFELEAEEVVNVLEDAVANAAIVGGFFVGHSDESLKRDFFFQLQAGARGGNVFQVGNGLMGITRPIAPFDLDQIRA